MCNDVNTRTAVANTALLSPRGYNNKNLAEGRECLLDLDEIAKFFGITKRTLYNWQAADKTLPIFEICGKKFMSYSDLLAYVAKKKGAAQ